MSSAYISGFSIITMGELHSLFYQANFKFYLNSKKEIACFADAPFSFVHFIIAQIFFFYNR